MSKAHHKPKRPNVAPAALLRARLEAAWLANDSAQQTPEQLSAALQAARQDLKPVTITHVVLSLVASAPPELRGQLEAFVPTWLAGQDDLQTLELAVRQGQLPAVQSALAQRWLSNAGRDVRAQAPSARSTAPTNWKPNGRQRWSCSGTATRSATGRAACNS